jgi:hypothetical protein
VLEENEGIMDDFSAPDYFVHQNQYTSKKQSDLEKDKSKTANMAELIHEFHKGNKNKKGGKPFENTHDTSKLKKHSFFS